MISASVAETIDAITELTGRPPRANEFEASTWLLRQVGLVLDAADHEKARATIAHVSRAMEQFCSGLDAVMTPTMAYPPVKIGELDLKPAERIGLTVLRAGAPKFVLRRVLEDIAGRIFEKTANTMLFNMTGQPAMSIPLWWNGEDIPIGIQFAGRFGEEGPLLRLAAQLKQARSVGAAAAAGLSCG